MVKINSSYTAERIHSLYIWFFGGLILVTYCFIYSETKWQRDSWKQVRWIQSWEQSTQLFTLYCMNAVVTLKALFIGQDKCLAVTDCIFWRLFIITISWLSRYCLHNKGVVLSNLHQGLWVFPDFQSPDCFALCVLDEMEMISLLKFWLEICQSTLAK